MPDIVKVAPRLLETIALTVLALLAFAGNSLLTRQALGAGLLDAGTFTAVRLATGALVLVAIVSLRAGWSGLRGRLSPALALFAYAAPFSFAYLRIGAAVGALVLFGSVQLTMIGWGVAHGERLSLRTWAGVVLAGVGLSALTMPRVMRPDPFGVALMVLAGVAWGAYSLMGKGVADPLAANARAFLGTVPLALALALVTVQSSAITGRGLALAVVSGGITSALGYAIWYRALRGLTATQAAIVQLSVPVIAALGAWLVLDETLTGRLAGAGAAVLGGVALVLTAARDAPARARDRGGPAISPPGR